MKRILYVALAALCCIACGSENEDLNNAPKRVGWEGPGLYGNIEKVTISEYTVTTSFGEENRSLKEQKVYLFNTDGNVAEIITDDSREICTYNDDGLLCKVQETSRWGGTIKSEGTITYHDNGKIAEAEEYSSGYLKKKSTFNKSGIITSLTEYDSYGRISKKEDYSYNKYGKIEKCISYSSSGSVKTTQKYIYDKKNKLTEIKEFDSDGKLDYRKKYYYHKNGNLKRTEVLSDNWGGGTLIEETYNKNGQIIKEVQDLTTLMGGVRKETSWKYDKNGKLIEWSETSEVGFFGAESTTEKYKYDQMGNRIEERTYKDDIEELTSIITYEIEYR